MLEQLFGSKTRVSLLKLFLNNTDKPFFLREITRKLNTQLNSVRREISNLEKIGIVKTFDEVETQEGEKKTKSKATKKFYITNTDFLLYTEIKALFLKSQLILESNLIKQIEKVTSPHLVLLSGIFVGQIGSVADMLIVGTVQKKKFDRLVKKFEKELNHEIRYTVLTKNEFLYRRNITDRFLYSILEGPKIVVIGEL